MTVGEQGSAAADRRNLRFAAVALMVGNLITGLAVLAPAGMLNELAEGLGISVPQAGWLVTSGAIVLSIGSPVVAWATSTVDRRALLCGTLALLAAGHLASAFAPNYATLLVLRLVMLGVAAVFTPQAASTIALMASEKDRAGSIAFVFLGWSLAVAGGLPLVTLVADHFGWRSAYGMLAGGAALACALTALTIPTRLRGAALSLRSWSAIAHNHSVLLLLTLTAVFIAGQFMIFSYLGPLLSRLAGAGPQTIAGAFGLLGVLGLIGNVIATRVVGRLGAFNTSVLCALSMLIGAMVWAFGAGAAVLMGLGLAFLGLGSFALNSMQQARLVAAAPTLASGTVALNTSSLYVGQAVGSWLSGALIAHDLPTAVGYAATAFMLTALGILAVTREAQLDSDKPRLSA